MLTFGVLKLHCVQASLDPLTSVWCLGCKKKKQFSTPGKYDFLNVHATNLASSLFCIFPPSLQTLFSIRDRYHQYRLLINQLLIVRRSQGQENQCSASPAPTHSKADIFVMYVLLKFWPKTLPHPSNDIYWRWVNKTQTLSSCVAPLSLFENLLVTTRCLFRSRCLLMHELCWAVSRSLANFLGVVRLMNIVCISENL